MVLRSLMQPDQPGAISTEFGRRLHLTVANRTGWFVGAEDDAKIGNGEVDRAHCRREDAVVEQAATGAEHHGERHQAEAIDEFVLQQRLEQFAASPGLQLVAVFVLQRLNRRHDVAGQETSGVGVLAAPRGIGLAERVGRDVLGQQLIAVAMGLAGRSDQASSSGRCRTFCDRTGTRWRGC